MPILDPSLMLTLLDKNDTLEYKSKSFILKCLHSASENLSRNLETIESAIQLKKDLEIGLNLVNTYYGSKIKIDEIDNKNIFDFLYSEIDTKFKADQAKYGLIGTYYLYGSNLKFFRPCLENELRSWYLTSTKVAILCIQTLNKTDDYDSEYIKLFSIEVDIMIACGYSVVICINYDLNSNEMNQTLIEMFKTHHFLEIHLILNLPKKSSYIDSNMNIIEKLLNLLNDEICKIESYFYLYSPFFNDYSQKVALKKLKQNPFFENFSFSKPVKEAIKKIELKRSNKFIFCKNGFKTDLIFVQMQNVPLYKSDDDENDFTPVNVSGFTTGYMKVQDFMKWQKTRVNVFWDDEENSNDFISQFVDFDDLHSIKIGTYVNDTLYLTKTAEDTLDSVEYILRSQFEKFYKKDEFKKETIFSFIKGKKIKKFLTYVSYAYSKHETLNNPLFSMHKNQIFTAFEACKKFLDESKKETDSGIIYQVETGEGKSCIICLIASLLALMKKTVHITSSNITLANRDYHESYNFFKMLGLKSAVLLHYNELPINLDSKKSSHKDKKEQNEDNQNEKNDESKKKKKSKDKNDDSDDDEEKVDKDEEDKEIEDIKMKEDNSNEFIYNPKFFPDEFFHKKLFQNSSNMNFSVCGFSNDNEPSSNKANIVFSTFVNFESFYLRLMEFYPGHGDDFFGNCFLIIDEADSILIDELTNGTILSRSMKTNGSEVLEFVYKSYMDKEKLIKEKSDTKEKNDLKDKIAEKVFKDVKEKYPKCHDLTLSHIKDMFTQIELVNQDEFQNGKKYSIETKIVKEKLSLKELLEKSKELVNVAQEKVKDTVKKGIKKVTSKRKIDKMKDVEESYDVEEIYGEEEMNESDEIDEITGIEDNENNDSYEVEEAVEPSKKKKSHDKKKSKEDKKKSKKDKKKEKEEKKKDKGDIKKEKEENIFKKTFKKRITVHKEIVPFDYDHKGVLEPNKEFSGFVQQFIAIKEKLKSKENQNMKIKDVSMNYLYVSHPIFVDLYGGVCGLTGTIGNFYDKKLFKEQYRLITKKIPRNKPNLRIEYPVILCEDITERNHKIASEVIDFNKKEYPVLVIFQDLNEISALSNLLASQGIKNINIFDGKDEKIKPDRIAGIKGAVSLGTNVCGRGTDIKNPAKPLHVIITYFTSNTRVMNQAFGRTARQGNDGSVRIICLKDQFIAPIGIFNRLQMDSVLSDFQIKNNMQIEFIKRYKSKRRWIFQGGIKTQKFTDKQMLFLRKTRININRLTSYHFEFPICMSIETFLLIQAQKIFSLYNCPNCKYTWILFQKYIREMILESWSLFIEQSEREYYSKEIKPKFEDYLKAQRERLYGLLSIYLPDSDDPNDYEIVPTFLKIFEHVKIRFESRIFSLFPDKLNRLHSDFGKQQYVSLSIGFKPYSLLDESGARINSIDGGEQKTSFILDPELIYMRKLPHHKFSILSITERIDDLFNMICRKINDVMGSKIGLKFFLRRTLGGCEFGVCFDFDIKSKDTKIINDYNCLVDNDPLLLFTIQVKSLVPILAGILIVLLVYVASVSKNIGEWISMSVVKLSKEIVVKTVKTLVKNVIKGQIEKVCEALIAFLTKKVEKQIDDLEKNGSKMVDIFKTLLKIASPIDFSLCEDKISDLFAQKIDECNIRFASKIDSGIVDGIPVASFLKVGFLLLLCISSFMINFHMHRQAVKYNSEKAAAKFDKNQNADEALNQNEAIIEPEITKDAKNKIEVIDAKFKDDNDN